MRFICFLGFTIPCLDRAIICGLNGGGGAGAHRAARGAGAEESVEVMATGCGAVDVAARGVNGAEDVAAHGADGEAARGSDRVVEG